MRDGSGKPEVCLALSADGLATDSPTPMACAVGMCAAGARPPSPRLPRTSQKNILEFRVNTVIFGVSNLFCCKDARAKRNIESNSLRFSVFVAKKILILTS